MGKPIDPCLPYLRAQTFFWAYKDDPATSEQAYQEYGHANSMVVENAYLGALDRQIIPLIRGGFLFPEDLRDYRQLEFEDFMRLAQLRRSAQERERKNVASRRSRERKRSQQPG